MGNKENAGLLLPSGASVGGGQEKGTRKDGANEDGSWPKGYMGTRRFKPLADGVLIDEDHIKTKTDGGIILPASAVKKRDQRLGTVLAVGEGALDDNGTFRPTTLKVGDRVVYSVARVGYLKIQKKPFAIGREISLLGIVGNEPELGEDGNVVKGDPRFSPEGLDPNGERARKQGTEETHASQKPKG